VRQSPPCARARVSTPHAPCIVRIRPHNVAMEHPIDPIDGVLTPTLHQRWRAARTSTRESRRTRRSNTPRVVLIHRLTWMPSSRGVTVRRYMPHQVASRLRQWDTQKPETFANEPRSAAPWSRVECQGSCFGYISSSLFFRSFCARPWGIARRALDRVPAGDRHARPRACPVLRGACRWWCVRVYDERHLDGVTSSFYPYVLRCDVERFLVFRIATNDARCVRRC
jgi:hypothetical protein